MPLEEPNTHREWIEVWKLTHARLWQSYANSEGNEKLLLEATQRYGRPCRSAVERAFQSVRAALTRTDLTAVEDDRHEGRERNAA
jgi:hypothetical protein